jgi:hypothetical protein
VISLLKQLIEAQTNDLRSAELIINGWLKILHGQTPSWHMRARARLSDPVTKPYFDSTTGKTVKAAYWWLTRPPTASTSEAQILLFIIEDQATFTYNSYWNIISNKFLKTSLIGDTDNELLRALAKL